MKDGAELTAVVGAGICGLTLAALLKSNNVHSVVIEKSRGVGGRLATRRDAGSTYDHGAAFYVHSEREPFIWHSRWQKNKKTIEWFSDDRRRYFCGYDGMTGLAKDLADGLDLQLNERVIRIERQPTELQIICESGCVYHAKRIVLTCPLPQSLEILEASLIAYPDELKNILFKKAIVGLFELDPQVGTFDFDLLKTEDDIFTISNNQAKGISENLALTIVMSDSWSERHFGLGMPGEDAEVLRLVERKLIDHFSGACKIQKAQLKKWRYAQPESVFRERHVSLEAGMILLAGDAFGGGSIAGTVRSAYSAFSFINQK